MSPCIIGALLVGYYNAGRLVYSGKVGTGFDDETLRRLGNRLAELETRTCPFAIDGLPRVGAHWVRPKQPRTGGGQLSKVGLHHIDHLIGRVGLLRIWFSLRVKHMVPDVAFQEFRHQAVDCTSCRADDLQHLRTIAPQE